LLNKSISIFFKKQGWKDGSQTVIGQFIGKWLF